MHQKKKEAAAKIVAASTAPAAPDNEEVAFIRGGGGGLTALQRRKLQFEGAAEAAAQFQTGRSSKRQRVSGTVTDEDSFFGKQELQGKLPKYVHLLKFKALTVGAKVWGAVVEITPKELIISLPHGLRAHVAATEASEPLAELLKRAEVEAEVESGSKKGKGGVATLAELFYVGQLVRGTVIDLQEGGEGKSKKKRIALSLHVGRINSGLTAAALTPGLALPAAVKSVEDHGYALTFGMKGVTGFLKRSTHEASFGDSAALKAGMLTEVAITSVTDGRLAHVTTEQAAVAGAVVKEWEGLDIGSLLPGSLVNARVRNVLSDGLLLSFLTYFNGTIDSFHLAQDLPPPDWRSSYSEGQRLRARILYVDPSSKVVYLSLQRHLLNAALHESPAAVGTVFVDARVRRVEPGFGVLLELPGGAGKGQPSAGFAHVSNLTDDRLEKVEKVFRAGQTVKARVIGQRPMDGLAVLTLRPSVVDQHLMSHADVQPGAVMTAKVFQVNDKGVIVALSTNIKAFVPNAHLSYKSKLKVGQEVRGRVLERDADAKKIVMTLKKALIGSKLPALTHLEDAIPGSRSHGYVTGITDYGVFVGFYGGLKGLVHAKELDGKPQDCFETGQVVKVRVESVDTSKKRLSLSLVARKTAAGLESEAATPDPLGALQPGDLVRGTVAQVQRKQGTDEGVEGPATFIITLPGAVKGRLDEAHLGDHPTAIAALSEVFAEGTDPGELMVIERIQGIGMVRLTRKASLIAARAALPSSLEDVKEGAILPGFIASATPDACFVRFLGHLTGRAGLAQLAGTFVSDPRRAFADDQSVRAQVVQVDLEKQRFSLALKPSLVASSDASLLRSLFTDLEFAATLKLQEDASSASIPWDGAVAVGAVVEGQVHARKEYGVLCDLAAHPDVVGLVAPEQEPETEAAVGSAIRGRVLDVSKAEGILDLSLRPELIPAKETKGKKKAAAVDALQVGQKVEGIVELIKDSASYLVISLPQHGSALGFAASKDYNGFGIDAGARFEVGQTVSATIAALPEPATGGRMLLIVSLTAERPAEAGRKRVRHEKVQPGSVVEGTVIKAHPLYVDVQLADGGPRGRLHITEWHGTGAEAFAAAFPDEGPVRAVSRGLVASAEGRKEAIQELTTRVDAFEAAEAGRIVRPAVMLETLKLGQRLNGYVQEVGVDHVWVALAACERGLLSAVESSADPQQISDCKSRFTVGQAVTCRVLQVERKRRHVDLSMRDVEAGRRGRQQQSKAGEMVTGRVAAIAGGGVRVQLTPHSYGRVALTDLHDSWVPNALQGISIGAGVRARVMSTDSNGHVQLSARLSDGGLITGLPAPESPSADLLLGIEPETAPASLTCTELKINQQILGYVKSVGQGVFVSLAGNLDGRVKLSQLSDGFVKDPAAEFPLGRLVRSKVLSVIGDRVELSLKLLAPGAADLADLSEGDTVEGTVKKVEHFGVFVRLNGSSLTGLAHKSELADAFVVDTAAAFQVGQEVRAKVLKVDTAGGKLSLGLKPSYFADEDDPMGSASDEEAEMDLDEELAEELDAAAAAAAAEGRDSMMDMGSGSDEEDEGVEDLDDLLLAERDSDSQDAYTKAAAAASEVSVLEISPEEAWPGLDEGDGRTRSAATRASTAVAAAAAAVAEAVAEPSAAAIKKLSKLQKKRAQADKEAAIRKRELAELNGEEAPETTDEFERLVVAQPNVSFVWVKYMAFLISLGDIPAARAVVERALKTINYREETEKFNVWLAYLNLENQFGEDAEEAALKLFQRASQYTDPKKLHLAALSMFERSDRTTAAEQVVKAMTRKFGGSAKVWLRAVGWELKKGDGEGARKMLERGLQSLPRRKHVKVITQAGLLEFKSGSVERGRGIFEGVLRNYPKRLDLWSVYLDQEIKVGEQPRIRALFERAAAMDLPAKKMKFFFKRWMEYEEQHGDAASVEHVKAAAQEFINSQMES